MRIRAGVTSLLVLVAAMFACLGAAAAAGQPLRGALDPTFGHGGRVFSKLPGTYAGSEFTSMLRQPDGRIVLAGAWRRGEYKPEGIVQRRGPTGELDPGFGSAGTVVLPRAEGLENGLALQGDGRILFGVRRAENTCEVSSAVRRLDPSGDPDDSFGRDGLGATVPLSIRYLAIDAAGRVLVAGYAFYNPCTKSGAPQSELALARLGPNGTLDPSFGKGGVVRVHGEYGLEETYASGLAIRADGTILVGGSGSLLAFSADGALDRGFGQGGVAAVTGGPRALLAMPDDGAAVASTSSSSSFYTYWRERPGDFGLSRYRADGSLDPGFGNGGRASLDVAAIDDVGALALAPDGDIVLAGGAASAESCGAGECPYTPILARFTAAGALDPGFGTGGWSAVEVPGGSPGYGYVPWIASLAVAPNGQILAAGGSGNRSNAFVLARQPDGRADAAFGASGALEEVHRLPSSSVASGLAIGSGGEIFASAWSNSGRHGAGPVLLRFGAGGLPDKELGGGAGFVPIEASGLIRGDGRGRLYAVAGRRVIRCDSSGEPDRGYGNEGVALLPKGFRVGSLLVRGDGRVVAVGRLAERRGMAAFGLDGRGLADRGFGRRGRVLVRFGAGVWADARAVAVDSRGRIVLAGVAGNHGIAAVAARLLPDGRLDRGFARRGRFVDRHDPAPQDILVATQRGGGVLIAGGPQDGWTKPGAWLLRLRDDGARDRSFGRGGSVRVGGGTPLVALFADRRRIVLVSGHGDLGEDGVDLRAYRANGATDRRFGRRGIVTAASAQASGYRPAAAARQADGRIVVAGSASKLEGVGPVELLRFR